MPLLRASYGLTRLEALKLPHWEFQQLVVAISQQQARDTLSLYQAVGMAFGGKPKDAEKYVKTLRKASVSFDRDSEPKEQTKSKTSIFSDITGIPSAAEYKAMVVQITNPP